MSTELVKINASDYGLEETKAQEVKAMFVPMLNKMDELEVQYNEVLKQEINPETCQMAKDLRLSYVKTRTETERIHKGLKAFYLNGGRFVDAFKNVQAAASGEKEKTLKAIEDHFENQEKERLEKIRDERIELLKPYTDIEPLALGHMEQAVFNNYLTGVKIAHEQRIAAEKKAEEERLAEIEAERIRQENIRLENERLKKEAEEKEKALFEEREKIRKENEEKERLAEIERKKQAKILADQKAKADKERAELLAKAEAERREKERLEKEIEAKNQAEEITRKEAESKIEAERKAKIAEEKKAKLAPDKTKILAFGQALNNVPRPEIKSIEAAAVMSQINGLLAKLDNYIVTEANKL